MSVVIILIPGDSKSRKSGIFKIKKKENKLVSLVSFIHELIIYIDKIIFQFAKVSESQMKTSAKDTRLSQFFNKFKVIFMTSNCTSLFLQCAWSSVYLPGKSEGKNSDFPGL